MMMRTAMICRNLTRAFVSSLQAEIGCLQICAES